METRKLEEGLIRVNKKACVFCFLQHTIFGAQVISEYVSSKAGKVHVLMFCRCVCHFSKEVQGVGSKA